ncbi:MULTISPECIES: GGDEF domain-containing protein [unclassified Duganella]|uniref:tetratricopeptide repeat-containing diguanylate cyclase n=1 Tax=unclassified Duganella TaxID=2636909 RepID=UPI00088C4F0F|nr:MULTISPECIES: GGDEF domain-containing protein [unclassified Duganella]SDF96570.1 diguanylate cyclase (GGDEF) domain-containing protein [Duganella sp. OV458]SDJ08228.1 diguanylate cyclase (GGDEF) domain-containing protein [Duganella sp. OV510]
MMAAVALTLAPAWALGQATLDERILDVREQSRFVPDKALVQLLKLQPELAAASSYTRAEFLIQMSAARMRLGQNDVALEAAEQVIAFGKSLHDNAIIAKGMLAKTYVLFAQAEVDAAHRLAFEAEKLALTTSDNPLKVQATITAGQTYAEQGNFPSALSTLQRAVDMARPPAGDSLSLVAALNALAKLHTQMKEYENAAETLAELLSETEKLDSPGRMAMAKNTEYGLAIDSGQPKRALRVLQESLALERRMGAERMVGITLVNLSDSYLKQHDFARAVQYAQESLQSAQKTNDKSTEATGRLNLGQAYLGMGRLAEGKKQYELGLARYQQENNKPDLQVALREYGEALERAGDLAGAVEAYHRERDISNELFEKRRQQAMLELQEKYEGEKKQRQIELLSHENQAKGAEIDNRRLQQRVWWLLALVFALAAAVVGLLYRKVRHTNAQLEVKNLELKAQSTLDPLTSLYNRRHFQDFMRCLNTQERQDDMVGALFLLDVDHFKHINDNYGHAAGDAVLKMIAESLRVALRETDMIVRWGGEEFLAFLPAIPRQGVDEVARRILLGISSQTLTYQEQQISVNVSVGFSPFPLAPGSEPLPWERAVNLVDMALYLAKAHGRNRAYGVRGFENFHLTTMEAIEQDLERAWRAGFVDLSVVLGGDPEVHPPTPDEHTNVVSIKQAAHQH